MLLLGALLAGLCHRRYLLKLFRDFLFHQVKGLGVAPRRAQLRAHLGSLHMPAPGSTVCAQ